MLTSGVLKKNCFFLRLAVSLQPPDTYRDLLMSLHGVHLGHAFLHGVYFEKAFLHGVHLGQAFLHGVHLDLYLCQFRAIIVAGTKLRISHQIVSIS